MKKKIKQELEKAIKQYKITKKDFLEEVLESYYDQYDNYILRGLKEEDAYKKIVSSFSDLVYYLDKENIKEVNLLTKVLITMNLFLNIGLVIFYIVSKEYNWLKIDYSVAIFVVASFVLSLVFILISFFKKGDSKELIKYSLFILSLYVPLIIAEVDVLTISSIKIRDLLSFYPISIFLIIVINTIFNKKINKNSLLVAAISILLFITRFLTNYPTTSFVFTLVAVASLLYLVVEMLLSSNFNKKETKETLLFSLVVFIIGILIEFLLAKSQIDLLRYYLILIGVIFIVYLAYERLFKGIKGFRYFYRAILIYAFIYLMNSIINLSYHAYKFGFEFANYYSVVISIVFSVVVLLVSIVNLPHLTNKD